MKTGRPRTQAPGLARMRAATPEGLCAFCLEPSITLAKAGKTCGDPICITAYHRAAQRDRRATPKKPRDLTPYMPEAMRIVAHAALGHIVDRLGPLAAISHRDVLSQALHGVGPARVAWAFKRTRTLTPEVRFRLKDLGITLAKWLAHPVTLRLAA